VWKMMVTSDRCARGRAAGNVCRRVSQAARLLVASSGGPAYRGAWKPRPASAIAGPRVGLAGRAVGSSAS
jgi:hypothetical protein